MSEILSDEFTFETCGSEEASLLILGGHPCPPTEKELFNVKRIKFKKSCSPPTEGLPTRYSFSPGKYDFSIKKRVLRLFFLFFENLASQELRLLRIFNNPAQSPNFLVNAVTGRALRLTANPPS